SILFVLPAVWWKRALASVPLDGTSFTGRLSADMLVLLDPSVAYTPYSLWGTLQKHWHALFFANHLLVPLEHIESCLSNSAADLETVLAQAATLANNTQSKQIEAGHIVAALVVSTPALQQLLTQLKLSTSDV